jgi:hypothetical protein
MGDIGLESLVIAISGYLIVFTALVLLFLLFNTVPRLLSSKGLKWGKKEKEGPSGVRSKGISGEETAAIAMALHLYLDELHDQESGVLTIKRISKAYSPWSSKIYAVRNQFNRN